MKILLVIRGYIIISLILVIFPVFLILANDYFSLPVYQKSVYQFFGLLLVLVGIFIILHCLRLFIQVGRGAPVPTEQPNRLVVNGLYRFTRNPMYLGIFLILFGEFLLFGHLLLLFYFLISVPMFHLNVIFREEPKLKRRFGGDYLKYTKNVPRWLPKI